MSTLITTLAVKRKFSWIIQPQYFGSALLQVVTLIASLLEILTGYLISESRYLFIEIVTMLLAGCW